MSTAADIEAAYGIDNQDYLAVTSASSSTVPGSDSTHDSTSVPPNDPPQPTTDKDAKCSNAATDTAPLDQPARPRIVRGRGNRLFGLMQSTLERANKDLVKDQSKITARIQIQDRVRQQHQEQQAKLAALQSMKTTRQRLERDVTDYERRIRDLQMQLDTPTTHLRIESSSLPTGGRGRGPAAAGGPYARPVILWRPGKHNERTRRELDAQRAERQRGLQASHETFKQRLERARQELEVAVSREREHEATVVDAAASDKRQGGEASQSVDVEMSGGGAAEPATEEPNNVSHASEMEEQQAEEHVDGMDQD